MTNHPNRSVPTFRTLQRRCRTELDMELFRDRVTLSVAGDGPGVYNYHLRASSRDAAWPHFRTLAQVAEYLDTTID